MTANVTLFGDRVFIDVITLRVLRLSGKEPAYQRRALVDPTGSVWSLVQEDLTRLRATKPVGHNYLARAL